MEMTFLARACTKAFSSGSSSSDGRTSLSQHFPGCCLLRWGRHASDVVRHWTAKGSRLAGQSAHLSTKTQSCKDHLSPWQRSSSIAIWLGLLDENARGMQGLPCMHTLSRTLVSSS